MKVFLDEENQSVVQKHSIYNKFINKCCCDKESHGYNLTYPHNYWRLFCSVTCNIIIPLAFTIISDLRL